jgi:hypothetical protein
LEEIKLLLLDIENTSNRIKREERGGAYAVLGRGGKCIKMLFGKHE